jgi:hypothetical protein
MLRINKAFSQSNLRLFTASSFGPTISNVIRPTRRYSELEVVGRRYLFCVPATGYYWWSTLISGQSISTTPSKTINHFEIPSDSISQSATCSGSRFARLIGYDGGMRFSLQELLMLVGCVGLGMGAYEFVRRFDSHDLMITRSFAALAIVLGAIVRYRLARRRNSQN